MSSRSLDFKLNASTLTLLILIIGVSFYSIFMINKTHFYAEDTGKNWLPSIVSVGELNRDLTMAPRRLITYTLDWFYDQPKETKTKSAESLSNYIKSFDEHLKA